MICCTFYSNVDSKDHHAEEKKQAKVVLLVSGGESTFGVIINVPGQSHTLHVTCHFGLCEDYARVNLSACAYGVRWAETSLGLLHSFIKVHSST